MKKKIALVGFRLSGGGGDKVMANLSNFFHLKGFEVHIIILHDEIGFQCSGTIFNLGVYKSNSNTILNKIKRFFYFKKYIVKHDFDFIIDFRFRINLIQEILINRWIYTTKTIYTIHSSNINTYLPKSTFLTKFIYGQSYSVVCVNQVIFEIVKKKYKLINLSTIYNPINVGLIRLKASEDICIIDDFIIGVGQFNNNVKQFDKLIIAYAKSELPNKNIALIILGEGKLKSSLLKIAENYEITHLVHFLGFKNNPYKFISKAKFLVLTSKYEGLPMVLLESLACSTPIISFDCPSGPKEIIIHKKNGLLVENENMNELIKAMNIFIEDTNLYNSCKNFTLQSVEKFSIDIVGQNWLELMGLDNI